MATASSMRRQSSTTVALSIMLVFTGAACTNEASTEPGDTAGDAGTPSALGDGLRIAQLNTPDASTRPGNDQLNVYVSGATFVYKDNYNETNTASSIGSIYMQDFHPNTADAGPSPPYSGILLYKTTFEPASLVLSPGDVVDLTGEYQLYAGPSSHPFGSAVQPEMASSVVVPRFDYGPPVPTVIDVNDLQSYATGYKWMSMLVTVTSTVGGGIDPDGAGRCGVFLTSATGSNDVTMDNELYNMPCQANDPTYGTVGGVHFASVTGIVTYFSNFHISPRSAADVVLE